MSGGSIDILHHFARFLNRSMGLYFRKERYDELEQKLAVLGQEQGFASVSDYLVKLMSAPLSSEQVDALAGVLTIGETYFLRDPKSYRVLEERLLPELSASRCAGRKSLTIWSAGCSSGEEPYSIAIFLKRALRDLAQWDVTLLASDINPKALERGRRGIYSRWSFRDAPEWLFDYFTRSEHGRYQISPAIRDMVRFHQVNLAHEADWEGLRNIDIIFCRNVMLYFDAAGVQKTMERFHGALNDGGWLFVGPTDISHHSYSGFSCHHYDGVLVLRKLPGEQFGFHEWQLPAAARPGASPPEAAGVCPPVVPKPQSAFRDAKIDQAPLPPPAVEPFAAADPEDVSRESYRAALTLYQAGRYAEAAEQAIRCASGANRGAALALAARSLANAGRLNEAKENCEKALECEKLSAQNHYLLSVILEQQEDLAGAAQSLKRAIFIDHDYLVAYFALGNIYRRSGDGREADRNFATALRLLERRHPHEVLPEADGMTAGRLAEMIRSCSGSDGSK